MTQAEQGRIASLVRELGLALRRITGKSIEIPQELLPFLSPEDSPGEFLEAEQSEKKDRAE